MVKAPSSRLVRRPLARGTVGAIALVVLGWAVPSAASAQTPAASPSASLPFRIFGRSYLRLGTSATGTAFALDRLYVNVDWTLWRSGAFKLNLEGGDFRDRDTSFSAGALASRESVFNVKTRAAYLEIKDLFPKGVLQLGQIGLPWVGYVDNLWGYRVLGPNFLDQSGYLSSVDLGATLNGQVPGELGDWAVSVSNGETWKSPELGPHKDTHARLTLRPLSPFGLGGLFVTGAGSVGAYDPDPAGPNERNRLIAQLGYRSAGQYLLALDYLVSASDPAARMATRYPSLGARSGQLAQATGFSAYGVWNLGTVGGPGWQPVELLARYDLLDPDVQIAQNGLARQTIGVSYQWNPALTTILAYSGTSYQAGANLSDEQRGLLSADIRY